MSNFGSGMPGYPGTPFPHVYALAGALPGYLGYADRNARPNADTKLRQAIIERLDALRHHLISRKRGDEADPAIWELEYIRNKIADRDSLANAFFNAEHLEEAEIEGLHAYDRKIIDVIQEMDSDLRRSGSTQVVRSEEWQTLLDRLGDLVDQRQNAMRQMGGM